MLVKVFELAVLLLHNDLGHYLIDFVHTAVPFLPHGYASKNNKTHFFFIQNRKIKELMITENSTETTLYSKIV